jgi:hypothetical protein
MDTPLGQPPGISPEAQAAIAAQQRIYQQELGLELQLRNAALHEAVEASGQIWADENPDSTELSRAATRAKLITTTAAIFLKFLKTGESNE